MKKNLPEEIKHGALNLSNIINVKYGTLYKTKNLQDLNIDEEAARAFVREIREELEIPLFADERNYANRIDDVIKHNGFVSAKTYLNVLLRMTYELTAGLYQKDDGVKAYCEGMYAFVSQYPVIAIEAAIKEFLRFNHRRPSPSDLINHIEGKEGEWCAIQQQKKDGITSQMFVLKSRAKIIENLLT